MSTVHNPIWEVTGQDGRKWVLKHLPQWPPGVGPVEEFRILSYLQCAGLPVALPVVTDDGGIAHNADNLGTNPNEKVPTGPDAYALIPLLPNEPTRRESPALALMIGTAIGRLDRLLAECPWQATSFTDDPGRDILGEAYPTLPTELRSLIDPLQAELSAAVTGLPMQLTHGDCNAGNVLVSNGEVTGYIDLDHLPHSPRIRDLSYYLASRLVDLSVGDDPEDLAGVLHHYVAGYHSAHPITEREVSAVVPLLLTALVGGAGWCLNGWVPDPEGYRRNLRAIEWMAPRYSQLVEAAAR